jgi:hypothetical protein
MQKHREALDENGLISMASTPPNAIYPYGTWVSAGLFFRLFFFLITFVCLITRCKYRKKNRIIQTFLIKYYVKRGNFQTQSEG